MILDLKELIYQDGETLRFSRMVPMKPIPYMGEEIRFDGDVEFSGQAKNMSGTIEIYAKVKGTLVLACARCTKDTVYNFLVSYNDSLESASTDSDNWFEINLENVITDVVLCEIPMRVLCKSDCKGLCPKCGADLNEGNCFCPSDESDSIWEKIKNLNLKEEV